MAQTVPLYKIVPLLESRGEWQVSVSDKSDPEFSFELKMPLDRRKGWTFREAEAVVVREKFFAIRTPQDALAFFNQYGPWQVKVKEGSAPAAEPFKWRQILSAREFFETALVSRAAENTKLTYSGVEIREFFKNLYMSWSPQLELSNLPLTIIARCGDIQEAVRACIRLDADTGIPWRRCKREACRKPFQVSSKRKKYYCGTPCAHLDSVQKMRRKRGGNKPAAAQPVTQVGKSAKPRAARKKGA